MMNYPGYYSPFGFWPGILSLIIHVLIWTLIIWAIVALVRHMTSNDEEPEEKEKIKKDDKYLEIVKERYARGEINRKEYESLKEDFS